MMKVSALLVAARLSLSADANVITVDFDVYDNAGAFK